MTKGEVAALIKAFVAGTCGRWDWDDFTSYPQSDPEIEKIRQLLLLMPDTYPPEKKGHYCSKQGVSEMLSLAERLEK